MTKHKNADLIMQYAIDAQHSETPWEFWEFQDGEKWYQCTRNTQPSMIFSVYRRKPDAPQFSTEKVCEWHKSGDKYMIACDDRKMVAAMWNYCPNCGGEVYFKPKTCSLSGIEYPMPLRSGKGHDFVWVVGLIAPVKNAAGIVPQDTYDKGIVQATEAGGKQMLKALRAAMKQAEK